jgi:hypothetical protein
MFSSDSELTRPACFSSVVEAQAARGMPTGRAPAVYDGLVVTAQPIVETTAALSADPRLARQS